MPADLTREKIQLWREGCRDDFKPDYDEIGQLLDIAEAHLDEPARLASARQEGYREGVEAAIKAAEPHGTPPGSFVSVDYTDGYGDGRTAAIEDIRTLLSPAAAEPRPTPTSARHGIYVASRASVLARGEMWRKLRAEGAPIISTWIDEDGEGASPSIPHLWARIVREVSSARALVLYAEADDFPLKGALVEVGMALAAGVPIAYVIPGVTLEPRSLRPLGSWAAHNSVRQFDSVQQAVEWAASAPVEPARPDGWIEWKGGECPVAPETVVETRYRNGNVGISRAAHMFGWEHVGGIDGAWDIVAYRIVKPAEPAWTPTHRHYKGGLYRELMRVEREGDCEPMVVYEAEDGRRWTRPAAAFDAMVVDPAPGRMWAVANERRRFEPIAHPAKPALQVAISSVSPEEHQKIEDATNEMYHGEPAEPGDRWIEWDGKTTLWNLPGPIDLMFRDGTVRRIDRPRPEFWRADRVRAYRPTKPAEPSAPVAEGE